MLPNGLLLTLDMALKVSPPIDWEDAFYTAVVLGLYAEDVQVIPWLNLSFPALSWRHIWPRSRKYAAQLYRRALNIKNSNQMKSGFELGRALHVLIDMACPAHAQNSWHYLKDPFERYVEAHASQLAALSVSYASLLPNPFKIESLIDSLAKVAQQEIVFSRRNRSILASKKDGVVAQVQRLIPLAAQHARHLIDAYEKGLAT